MQWINDFVRKYPKIIVSGPVSMSNIIEKMKRDYNAEEMLLDIFPPYRIKMQQENVYYYARDEHINLRMEDIKIKIVRIPVTDQTRHYTEKDFTSWSVNDIEENNGIYIVYEETTGYFYCNSSMLHLELTILRGIPESDVRNKTEKYRGYIGLIERYIENYTDLKI